MDPRLVPEDVFESMVVDALDALPEWMAPIVQEIAVLVEDVPAQGQAPEGTTLLGLFHGIPRTAHGGRVAGTPPDTITLFRIPIVRACTSPESVPDRVLKVLGHEVGHAMGLKESKLRSLGWY